RPTGGGPPTDPTPTGGIPIGRIPPPPHFHGNPADVERCSNASSFPNQLCLQDDGFPRPSPVTQAFRNQFVILDQNNNTIPCPPGSGNTCATVPYGTLDRTKTSTLSFGTSLQLTS